MNIERRVNPYDAKNAENTEKKVLEYLESRQEINHHLDPYKSDVRVIVDNNNFPLKVIHCGDTHLTHVDSKISGLPNAVKQAGKDGLLITHANLIDSVSSKFVSTNIINVGLNLDQQVDLAKKILNPVDTKKHLIVIGANTCHEGWSYKTSTHDCTRDLISPETPMLFNGGQVVLVDENGKEIGRSEGYHNGGKGMTKMSPEGSMRERSREVPDGGKDKANVFIDAHMHQLVADVDVHRNPITKKDVRIVLGEVGASKGTKDNPDRFINGLGVPPRNQPGDCGEGLVVIWKKDKKGNVSSYPVADYERANIIYDAEKLYENAQRTGTYGEIYGEIMASGKFNNPKKELIVEDCRLREQDVEEDSLNGTTPLYESIVHDIKSDLPLRIHFIGNTRVGSASFEREKLKSDLKNIESDPWAYFYAMGNLINRGTATSFNREKTLTDLADLLDLASTSSLGVMLSDELMSSSWKGKRTKKNGEGEKEIAQGLLPGDFIYERLRKETPIIMPKTVSLLNLKSSGKKEVPYTMFLTKEVQHFTSIINPHNGLARMEGVFGIQADLLVGGDSEIVGWRTLMKSGRQLETLIPGGYSKYDKKGNDNRVDYPSGGQGTIIFPGQKRVYSFASFEEGRDMHESLVLYEGLRKLGTLPEIRRKLQKQ
jgi:hypothetical protein